MRVGRLNLTVFSSALFCLGTICAAPSEAMPQRPWYIAAFDHVLNLVSNDGDAALLSSKQADKQAGTVYVSRITKEEGTITLKGDVPSESDLKFLKGVAEATSTGAAFVDKSRLNANVPDRDAWLAAMIFALRQLGKLEHGVVQLRNSSILIEGVTKSGDDFASVQKKLRDEAPKGLALQAAVKPHGVHPFVWVAQLQPGSLSLSGHVPGPQGQPLCNYAQNLFQNRKVNNSMEFAEGEPRDWFEAAKVTLDMLALLYAGNASISDNTVKLEGVYPSPEMAPEMAARLKAFSEKLQAGYQLEQRILEPVARASGRVEDVSLASHTAPATLDP